MANDTESKFSQLMSALARRVLSEHLPKQELGSHPSEFSELLKDLGLPEMPDEVFSFRRALSEETDRGCALLASAYLDEQLEVLLRAFFIDKPAEADKLLNGREPLATFSARVQLCLCLGLLPKSTIRELHLIRRIRNEFAHVSEPLSFDTPAMVDRCKELGAHDIFREDQLAPRKRFIRATLGIAGVIETQVRTVKHCQEPSDINMKTTDGMQELRSVLKDLVEDAAVDLGLLPGPAVAEPAAGAEPRAPPVAPEPPAAAEPLAPQPAITRDAE